MHDVRTRADIEAIVEKFYADTLDDPIIGFIFKDVAQIDLAAHLPVIFNFWQDVLFEEKHKLYAGNTLKVHLDLAEKIALRPGHFTRWLYLFDQSVDHFAKGVNADKMKARAASVAKSIAASLTDNKRGDMQLTLE